MARTGVTEAQVKEAVDGLMARGKEVTTNSVRAALGSGSFSTISALLAKLRDHQANEANVPPLPATLSHLFCQLWVEAWKLASTAHEAERQAFERTRGDLEARQKEMSAEIQRLEKEAVGISQQLATAKAQSKEMEAELNRLQIELAAAKSRGEALDGELQRCRQELTSWVERSTKAEARLELRGAP